MRPVHFLFIALSLAVVALIYWGGNTIPPSEPVTAEQQMAEMGHAVHPASFDSILAASRKQLPGHALSDLALIEQELLALEDSSSMISVFERMAQAYREHRQLSVAAYYMAQAAKLENSEKKLNFAGQFFLDLMQQTSSPGVRAWQAQEAIACFEQSLDLNPENDTTKLAISSALIEGAGETMKGVQMLLGLTREDPDNIPANLMLGRLSIESGQFEKSIERYQTVLNQEPENTEALYFQAEAYKGLGNKEKAIALLEECKRVVNNPAFSREIDQYIESFK